MQHRSHTPLIAVFIALAVALAIAGFAFGAAARNAEGTRIETTRDAIIFIVGGEEKARLDENGFHVNGNIEYSGTIADTNQYSTHRDNAPSESGDE